MSGGGLVVWCGVVWGGVGEGMIEDGYMGGPTVLRYELVGG